MEVAHIRWHGVADIMTKNGVVWNDRPRLYSSMLLLARFKSVEMATLAAFEGQRRPDGTKIPFTPENYWEIIPYLYATERTACKVFHYCASESLGVNYNFPIMNSLFEALLAHEHTKNDEEGVRTRFMESSKYDQKKMVVVYKNRSGGRSGVLFSNGRTSRGSENEVGPNRSKKLRSQQGKARFLKRLGAPAEEQEQPFRLESEASEGRRYHRAGQMKLRRTECSIFHNTRWAPRNGSAFRSSKR